MKYCKWKQKKNFKVVNHFMEVILFSPAEMKTCIYKGKQSEPQSQLRGVQ